ncbi:Histone deacetylase, partial [Phytophthora palmivora]
PKQTPAHIAALAGFAKGVEILRNSPRDVAANFALKDSHGSTPAQVAHRCAFDALEKRLLAGETGEGVAESVDHNGDVPQLAMEDSQLPLVRSAKDAYDAWSRMEGHFEKKSLANKLFLRRRFFTILRSREFQRPNVKWDHDIERADIADILRVHEFHYVDRIRQKCASLTASTVGKDPVVSKNDGTSHHQFPGQPKPAASSDDAEECHATFSLDLDTALSVRSYDAATRAAGAVCKAVDEVVAGHHAGPVGKVVCENDPEGSLGFCLFNNVAVGAAYARAHLKHRGINKVAILDFDVHHGNGTEEIVRQLVPSTKEIVFETPYGVGKQVVHQYKPWRSDDDAENVFFCSVHGYGHKDPENKEELAKGETQGWFYPGSASRA